MLAKAGHDRKRTVGETVSRVKETLEEVAKKYKILGSKSKRHRIWSTIKWSIEFRAVDGLRNKLINHNTAMNLLLKFATNSSLERIEKSNDALEDGFQDIRTHIMSHKFQSISVSAVDDELFQASLTAAFTKHAEISQR